MVFDDIVPEVNKYILKHHELYSGRCKGEYWEEITAKALINSGYGSDWTPDFNHAVGVDQTTSCGIRISNKSGQLISDKSKVKISGSRLTSHPSLDEKLSYLEKKHEDYIFCLATDNKDWKNGQGKYYMIVIDSKDLDYKNASWTDITHKNDSSKVTGHVAVGNGFTAKIQKSMSDQLWTTVDKSLFKACFEIT